MSTKTSSVRVLKRLSRWEWFMQSIGRRFFERRRRRMKAANHPRFAIIPDDEIGLEILQYGLYERVVLELIFDNLLAERIPRFTEQTALDIGANIGNHTIFLARRFNRVLAFEPGHIASHLLRANIALNCAYNVEFLPVGLSDVDQNATLRQDEADNLGTNRIALEHDDTESEQIVLRRGDELLGELDQISDLALIKIDIEGLEVHALRGLAETLRKHRPIILFETAGKYGPAGSDALLALLREAGYDYFYTLGKDFPLPRFQSAPARAAIRALCGTRYILEQRESIDDRFYNLVIASDRTLF